MPQIHWLWLLRMVCLQLCDDEKYSVFASALNRKILHENEAESVFIELLSKEVSEHIKHDLMQWSVPTGRCSGGGYLCFLGKHGWPEYQSADDWQRWWGGGAGETHWQRHSLSKSCSSLFFGPPASRECCKLQVSETFVQTSHVDIACTQIVCREWLSGSTSSPVLWQPGKVSAVCSRMYCQHIVWWLVHNSWVKH